eukprot:NODE_22814_length_693_cov_3.256184.p3 GENE.NODE_22814_length_693_cov_3.256184~~NODE_22814_length_693_cov_3.256184.p3  ORF type:complete len:74 (-),score=8.69 NODE_22814_length_693_cov_3.256184:158-379(-)
MTTLPLNELNNQQLCLLLEALSRSFADCCHTRNSESEFARLAWLRMNRAPSGGVLDYTCSATTTFAQWAFLEP